MLGSEFFNALVINIKKNVTKIIRVNAPLILKDAKIFDGCDG